MVVWGNSMDPTKTVVGWIIYPCLLPVKFAGEKDIFQHLFSENIKRLWLQNQNFKMVFIKRFMWFFILHVLVYVRCFDFEK